MPSRVPLKIFKLVQTKTGTFDLAPTQYAPDVDTRNIVTNPDGSRTIGIQVSNPVFGPGLPDTITVIKTVWSDGGGDFIIAGSDRLYIKSVGQEAVNQELSRTNPAVFEFYVNPQRLTPTYSKIQTEIRTRGGWEIQHWGNALTEMSVEGHSGGMHRRPESGHVVRSQSIAQNSLNLVNNGVPGDSLSADQDITDSTAWKRLIQLKSFFDGDHATRNQEQLTLLGLSVYDSFYIGYFVTFTGPTQEADKPYLFSYQFTMKILQESTVSTLAPSLVDVANAGTIIGSQNTTA